MKIIRLYRLIKLSLSRTRLISCISWGKGKTNLIYVSRETTLQYRLEEIFMAPWLESVSNLGVSRGRATVQQLTHWDFRTSSGCLHSCWPHGEPRADLDQLQLTNKREDFFFVPCAEHISRAYRIPRDLGVPFYFLFVLPVWIFLQPSFVILLYLKLFLSEMRAVVFTTRTENE